MEHPLERAIRAQLVSYLAGESSLDEFKAWLVSATWNPGFAEEPRANRLASRIRLALAEHSGGFSSDEELRHELTSLHNISAIEAEVAGRLPSVNTESTSRSITSPAWLGRGSVFGEPRVVASAT